MKTMMATTAKNTNTSNNGRSCRRRLVLYASPFQGHIRPMFQLATLLYSKGFSISIVHPDHFDSSSLLHLLPPPPPPPPSLSHPNHFINLHPISSSSSTHGSSLSPDNFILYLQALNLNYILSFRDYLANLLSQEQQQQQQQSCQDEDDEGPVVTCAVIADAIMHFTKEVTESFKLPWLVLRTSSAVSYPVFAAFPLFIQKGYFCMQDDSHAQKLEEPLIEFPPLKVKDLPTISTRNVENADTLYKWLANVIDKSKASSGIIWNSFESLEQSALDTLRHDFKIPMFAVGPLHKSRHSSSSSSSPSSSTVSALRATTQDAYDDKSQLGCIISWLDRQAPSSVLYVSFGSIAAVDEAEFVEIAWGLANSDLPFLWVVRPGFIRGLPSFNNDTERTLAECGPAGEQLMEGYGWLLPDGFMERCCIDKKGKGCIVKWAPQEQVLGHPAVGGFWTHNGWNSTMESICEGVPMLCRPCFGDQMVNARYVSEVWRVGLQLESGRLERGEIEQRVKELMGYTMVGDDDDNDNGDEQQQQQSVRAGRGSSIREEMMVRLGELKEQAKECLMEGGSSSRSLENLVHLIHSFNLSI